MSLTSEAPPALAAELLETLQPAPPPLELYEGSTLRVRGTRIPLERIVYAFGQGNSPEEIVGSFPTLSLGDVYTLIGYYLWHREAVDAYLRQREREADEVEQQVRAQCQDDGLRERLLARRANRP